MSRHSRRSPGPRPASSVGRGWVAGTDVRIELAGHTAALGALRAHPERYTSWFAAARRHPGHGICRCTRSGERLVIREGISQRSSHASAKSFVPLIRADVNTMTTTQTHDENSGFVK